jgi:hypothetical protein
LDSVLIEVAIILYFEEAPAMGLFCFWIKPAQPVLLH